MRITLAFFLIFFLLHTLAFADQTASGSPFYFENGYAAYNRQDYQAAVKILQPLATLGDARSLLTLGELYAEGKGVGQDYVEAAKLWRVAADQGNAGAQCNLGNLYYKGLGVTQDYAAAYFWFHLTLNTDKYFRVAQDLQDAAEKYLAEEQIASINEKVKEWKATPAKFGIYGFPCISLGEEIKTACEDDERKYYADQDDPKSPSLTAAAEAGSVEAQYRLGNNYRQRWVKRKWQKPEEDAEAVKWYRMAAEGGYAPAQWMLGVVYAEGWNVKKDCAESSKWIHSAAAQGYDAAISAIKNNPWCPGGAISSQSPTSVAVPAAAVPTTQPPTDPCEEYQAINPAFYASCKSRMKSKQ